MKSLAKLAVALVTLVTIQVEAREVNVRTFIDIDGQHQLIPNGSEISFISLEGKDQKLIRRTPGEPNNGMISFSLDEKTGFIDKDKIKIIWACALLNPRLKKASGRVNDYYLVDFGRAGRVFTLGEDNLASEPITFVKDTGRCTK